MQVPYIMSPGFPARSGEVNANFEALANAITALEAKVAVLEGTTIPIAGSYTLQGFQTDLMSFGSEAVIEGILYFGTVTLGADHSASMTVTEHKNELHINPSGSSRAPYSPTSETLTGTWAFANGKLTLTLGSETINFGRGAPRMFVGSSFKSTDGSSVMLFMLRNGA